MPALGMAQETGKVLRWLKAEGDEVVKGEPLMEVETDKVTVEVEAPADGRLTGVKAEAGTDIPVGEAVAVILGPGEAGPDGARPVQPDEAAAEQIEGPKAETIAAVARDRVPKRAANRAPGRPLASPKARRLAAEHGIDLDALEGTGPHGAVLAADVADASAPAPPAAAPGAVAEAAEEVSVGRVWRIMAERTTQSWTSAPHFYLEREVRARRLSSWRAVARERVGRDLTYTDLLVRVAAAALRDHPRVNAAWHDGAIRLNRPINIGVAVAVEDGLVVPVIHGADELGLEEIAARREALVGRAREGKLRPEDVEGGTFTISNLGMYGVDAFNAVLSPPQAAILAVGRIVERVVPVDGRPAVEPALTLTLSCDHRAIDGARGAEFLAAVAELIEEPAGLAG